MMGTEKYSKYNVFLQDFPKKKYTTIYNLFTKKMICCREDMLFPNPNPQIINKLFERGMVKKDIENEQEDVITYFNRATSNKETLTIMFLLTGNCNFRCTYCYESEFALSATDFSVFEDSLSFIYKEMKKGYKQLHIMFYGGEPLLKKDLIKSFIDTLYNKYEKSFTFSIVTNGSLLKKHEVEEWLKKGLARIKVTVDGNEASHNKKRPYKNGKGSYKDIIENLQALDNNVDLLINMVIDDSLTGVEEMIDELNDRGINAKFQLSLKEPEIDDVALRANQLIQLTAILKQKGVFQYSNIGARHGEICSAKKENFLVVDMSGIVYACNGTLCKDKSIGNIKEGVSKKPYFIEKRCLDCKYLPVCFGECRYIPKCQKEYFDIVVPELLKIYIQPVKQS